MLLKEPQSLSYKDHQASSFSNKRPSFLILIKENALPSTGGHVIQIHSTRVPLEQLLLPGILHKQSLLVGHTCQSE